jgi:hypothetical protein
MEIRKALFDNQWNPLVGGLLIGFASTIMFAFDSPWAVFTGLRNWGLHLLEFIPGIGDVAQISPLEYKTSVMNIAFLLGAFSAALLSGKFSISIPPAREALKGFLGGVLMGIGANFSTGCTVGGFYSSIAALSGSGLYMMLGLLIGAVVGLKLLIWEKRAFKPTGGGSVIPFPVSLQLMLGGTALFAGIFAIPYYYDYLDYNELGIIFAIAMFLGIANQRSRFCFVRSFREPFLTGDGEMTKAVIASFMVVIIGFTVLKYSEIKDIMVLVAPSAGWPAILGGLIFGVGMSLAGGCASGSLWRAGEGHLKLWLAILGFAISAAATHIILNLKINFSYLNRIFLPNSWDSWIIGILIPVGVMYIWYWIVSWNEKSEKLVIT